MIARHSRDRQHECSSHGVHYRGIGLPSGSRGVYPGPTMPEDDRLDTLAYTLARYAANSPRLAFGGRRDRVESQGPRAPGRADRAARRSRAARTEVRRAEKRTGHTRIPVTFSTRNDLAAFGYLLVPDGLTAPAPAVVCLPGHGRGVDDLVGIAEDGSDRDHDDGYQHDFAVQCVRQGYVAFALELMGFGHRRDPGARKSGPSASSCQTASGAALMLASRWSAGEFGTRCEPSTSWRRERRSIPGGWR